MLAIIDRHVRVAAIGLLILHRLRFAQVLVGLHVISHGDLFDVVLLRIELPLLKVLGIHM